MNDDDLANPFLDGRSRWLLVLAASTSLIALSFATRASAEAIPQMTAAQWMADTNGPGR